MGRAASARGAGRPRVRTWRPCGPVIRSTSMAPGPALSHLGTCDAPKCPPRAQAARLRPSAMAARGRHLAAVLLRPSRRPAARHAPGVEPAHDRLDPDERAASERLAGMAEHADLHAHPALGVHVLRVGPDPAGRPVEVIGRAERTPGPQDGDELGGVTGERVPDEMARSSLADQPLRGRLNRYRARGGTERQPDRAGRAADQGASVSLRPDAPCFRHPCVCHASGSPPIRSRPCKAADFSPCLRQQQ